MSAVTETDWSTLHHSAFPHITIILTRVCRAARLTSTSSGCLSVLSTVTVVLVTTLFFIQLHNVAHNVPMSVPNEEDKLNGSYSRC